MIILLCSSIAWSKSKIARYKETVQNKCLESKLNSLLLKKSLFELVKGESCDGTFTKVIISKCKSIDCQDINSIYRDIQISRSGSVVGEQ